MMTTTGHALREEHDALRPQIDHLREIAHVLGTGVPAITVRDEVTASHSMLVKHLIPHAMAEDAVLYPAVAEAMGSALATRTMTRDHVEISRLIDELGWAVERLGQRDLTSPEVEDLKRVLYSLHALITLHLAEEEEIYLPLLEQSLSAQELTDLYARMVAYAHGLAHPALSS